MKAVETIKASYSKSEIFHNLLSWDWVRERAFSWWSVRMSAVMSSRTIHTSHRTNPSLLVSCPHHYSGVRREGSGPWESPFMRILIIQPCWSVWEISPQTTDKLTSFSWKCHANRENLSEKKSCQKDIWVYLETQPFFVLPNESQQEHHWIVYWSAVTVNISFCDRLQILNITKQSRGVELLINC